jgi:hypothetical protein
MIGDLAVNIISATDLVDEDWGSGFSDPYCVVIFKNIKGLIDRC